MVTPDGQVVDVSNLATCLESELGHGSVVVEACHSSERRRGKILGVVLADQRVGVSWVADNDSLDITGAVVIDGFADINKDFSVILEQVSAFHAWTTGLGTNQEVVVDILHSNREVASDYDIIQQGESTVMKFSLDTPEYLLLEGQVKQVKDHSLILAEELSAAKINKRIILTRQF